MSAPRLFKRYARWRSRLPWTLALALPLTVIAIIGHGAAAPRLPQPPRHLPAASHPPTAQVDATPVSANANANATVAPSSALPRDTASDDFAQLCSPCHGLRGDGHGPAAPWQWPRPRDFTANQFKWRSAFPGQALRDGDLIAAIAFGAPGTSMPPFAHLGPARIAALAQYVRNLAGPTFAPASASAEPSALRRAGPATSSPTAFDVVAFLGAAPAPAPTRGAALVKSLGCAACHSDDWSGKPGLAYDLAHTPLRRPRVDRSPTATRAAFAASIATGLEGTAMPSFARMVPAADIWALADHLMGTVAPNPVALSRIPLAAQQATPRVEAGYWPGDPRAPEFALFGGDIGNQGPASVQLAPAQRSLFPAQCARCHAAQWRQWRQSLHARAVGPGLLAQVQPFAHPGSVTAAPSPSFVQSCLRCHAPLGEQNPMLQLGTANAPAASTPASSPPAAASNPAAASATSWQPNPQYLPQLRDEAIACAACHVRNHQRFGPPRLASSLLPLNGYPLTTTPGFERSDFCLPCHQLPPHLAVVGKPLLNTYQEWLTGPYMARGVQCQHCHMPNREHTFWGVHDPETVRQAMHVSAVATRRKDGQLHLRAFVKNIGAGHMLPTTPTPALWLRIAVLDAQGRVLPSQIPPARIGRDIVYTSQGWHERSDTRIAPGQVHELARALPPLPAAASIRVTVDVVPDDYYEGLYQRELAKALPPAQRALYAEALTRAQANRYTALTLTSPIH